MNISTPTLFRIIENQPLKPFTTFKIGGPARAFAGVDSPADVSHALELAEQRTLPVFVLGGGSNVLISDRGLDAVVLHPVRRGITVLDAGGDEMVIRAEGGESWDHLVGFAVERGWRGIENLSHIPGQAGAALVQNIGAYGQQLSDVLESAEVMDLSTGEVKTLGRDECGLAYRRSIFNTTRKSRYLIFSLVLRLSKNAPLNLSYPDLAAWFEKLGSEPSLGEVRSAVISIRDTKFPFPVEERGGNAGSFFKNVILPTPQYESLERAVRDHFGAEALMRLRRLPGGMRPPGDVKVPAALLIDLSGLKGHRVGCAAVNAGQPLVIINLGGAMARDVLLLARHIRQTVYAKTGVALEIEPELAGFTPAELRDHLALE
ncbi:MAG: UDP-N-acetylmuramate dehydrogenase [Terriglobia bacterium]